MHKEQIEYILKIKHKFPWAFTNKIVLDVGAFDVCGNEKQFFDNCLFLGLDIGPGDGVDIICPAQDYNAPDSSFDTIISCECWEHNPFYKESILNCVRMLKSGGFFIFTCAKEGRPVHGVSSMEDECKIKFSNWKTMPNVFREQWDNDYYKNLNEEDIREFLKVEDIFSVFQFETEDNHHDLYFWGIKK